MRVHAADFNLYYTLDCGQVFRWDYEDGVWSGVVDGHVLHVEQTGDTLLVDASPPVEESFVRGYFGLDDDLERIYGEIVVDEVMRGAVDSYWGLRLIRQDPWECLISYIMSSLTPIPTIKRRVKGLSQRWGAPLDGGYHAFPTPKQLASASVEELEEFGLGFRARYVHDTTRLIASGGFDLDRLHDVAYEVARRDLMRLSGVGGKVADVVCLFSLGKTRAFPVDTHVDRVLRGLYDLDVSRERMGEWARDYYGRYAGYAQEYLYYWARNHPSLFRE